MTDTARHIRKEIREAFPGWKISVRIRKIRSGPASILIRILSGPSDLKPIKQTGLPTSRDRTFRAVRDLSEYPDLDLMSDILDNYDVAVEVWIGSKDKPYKKTC